MARLLLLALTVALTVSACGGGASGPVELTGADAGSVVELAEGQALVIRLESNQTTGFRWNVVEAPPAETLAEVSSAYVEPEDGLVGAGGTEVWTFEAVGAGEGPLRLDYFRPFEPDDVQGTFAITVRAG
jgi:inhibitor of cysteine peptidase